MFLVPKRQQGIHRRVQPKKAVEIENGIAWNVDARPHRVIRGLTVWDDDVEAVCSATLENHD
jgi:hypothetical protein